MGAYILRTLIFMSITQNSRVFDAHMVLARSHLRRSHVWELLDLRLPQDSGRYQTCAVARVSMKISRNGGSNELPSSCILLDLECNETPICTNYLLDPIDILLRSPIDRYGN